MALTVTSSGRRAAMAALLALAAAGAVIRFYAPNPSTLRDVGSLLLVLWLPAIGNLISFFVRKLPRSVPPATEFAEATGFAPHLQAQIEATGTLAVLGAGERRCTLVVGRRGFTARMAEPLRDALAVPGAQTLQLELLHPQVALRHLAPGTRFHLLVGTNGVARGQVVAG